MPVSANKFAPRRDFGAEAAAESDANLAAVIAKLQAARNDPDANRDIIGAQLRAYEAEQNWRAKHKTERSALKTRIIARRGAKK